MKTTNAKIELLAPAGDVKRAIIAMDYGADAIYLGGKDFSLRAHAINFTDDDIREVVQIAHSRGKKVFVTVNIIPRNDDFAQIVDYAKRLDALQVDAVIVADLGVIKVFREHTKLAIHVSTQANITNKHTALEYVRLGATRLVLARELNITEIKEICDAVKGQAEIEVFVHGAMCVSYSGRCLLSNYMTNRASNRGDCAHSCRYKYVLQETKRPNEYWPIEEDEHGTYILNSRDMCQINRLPELIAAGVTSFKIEGRVKSTYYVAGVTHAYRQALDGIKRDYLTELDKISHRPYTTGFTFEPVPTEYYPAAREEQTYEFIGLVNSAQTMIVKNKINPGDVIEILSPELEADGKTFVWQGEMQNQPETTVEIKGCPYPLHINDILRRPKQ
ncbi:MAG: U32 family peptidase [Clostridia bacterium]|nr:U32 family peptidase [Clostridia bacterium]